MNPLRRGWLVSLLGLSACASVPVQAPPPIPATTARWISTITFPNLYGYPAAYRGEFVSPGQCEQAFRAAVALMANHKGTGTVSPCVVGVASPEVRE